jgi:hypothetical protein
MDSIPTSYRLSTVANRHRQIHAGWLLVALGLVALQAGFQLSAAITLLDDGYHVHPGDEIQEAMQAAATNQVQKTVRVHAGEYRSRVRRQALVWFNRSHDGIHLVAEGAVTLTAANPELALPSDPGFPAVVNHVVYFGDGVSSNTVIQGFRLTGANAFLTRAQTREMEPSTAILKNFFFYSDGGAIKVFGRSYPVLRDLTLIDNFTRPCGAGISIQHQGHKEGSVRIENCVFRNNRAQGTGGALDLLVGSAAEVVNCLFVENTSNTGEDMVAKNSGERPFVNNGVVTLFWNSKAVFQNCTFVKNRNGVDDMGNESTYLRCLFGGNTEDTGLKGHSRYELAINAGGTVRECVFAGQVLDAQGKVSAGQNRLSVPPPPLDAAFVPQGAEYRDVGYRPKAATPPR